MPSTQEQSKSLCYSLLIECTSFGDEFKSHAFPIHPSKSRTLFNSTNQSIFHSLQSNMYPTLLSSLLTLTLLSPALSHPAPMLGVKSGPSGCQIYTYADAKGCGGAKKESSGIYPTQSKFAAQSYRLSRDLYAEEALDFYGTDNAKVMMVGEAKKSGCHDLPYKMTHWNFWVPA